MKKQTIIIGTVLAVSVVAPVTAFARPGYATADVHLRAGPSTNLPIVTTIDGGDRVNIHGCLNSYNWCDVTWRGERGWVYSSYLRLAYRDRRVRVPRFAARIDLPVVSFSFGDYWDRHYRHRNWHHRRGYWRDRFARHHPGWRHNRSGRDRDHDRDARRGGRDRDHDRDARRRDRDRDHERDARRGGRDRTVGRGDRDNRHQRDARRHDRSDEGLQIRLGPSGINIR